MRSPLPDSFPRDGCREFMIDVLFVVGTRPEGIKLAPVIKRLGTNDSFRVSVCNTGQHREMLDQVLRIFGIVPDYDLRIMGPSQSLFDITKSLIAGLEETIDDWTGKSLASHRLIMVQGDTTTTFIAALSAFYRKITLAHVEAGLRSFDKYRPYPEELNRRMTGVLADIHFAPTEKARQNLLREGVKESRIFVTGNTVIDALFDIAEQLKSRRPVTLGFEEIDFSKRIILVTAHRRESFGPPLNEICECLKEIALSYEDTVEIVYSVHLNPEVRRAAYAILGSIKNVHLMEPLPYDTFIWLMNGSYMVLTDSGGLQEEAPAFGKPVLVLRDTTERTEGIEAGTAKLVGTAKEGIRESVVRLLEDPQEYSKMARAVNPYGDGKSREVIESILLRLCDRGELK